MPKVERLLRESRQHGPGAPERGKSAGRENEGPAVKYQWLSSADASPIIAGSRKSVVKLIDT